MAKQREESVLIKVEWGDMDDLPTIFANHLAVTHASGEEFYLIFGEAAPPTGLFKGDKIETITIKPVVKLAIPPGSMLRVSQLISGNTQNFVDSVRRDEKKKDAKPNK